MGTGAVLALLVGAAVFRAIAAGCPHDWGDLACLFFPTHTDLGIHLLSYAFMGTILLGTSSWLALWRRQWTNTHALTRKLARPHAPDNKLELLTHRLGLKGKVHLLDSEAPLCFCAGFIRPRVYLSRRTVEKLTPEELEALLLHEKHHMESYDPLKILLGKLVVSALFFIPVLPAILKRYLIEKEIAADQRAIQYQGHRRGIAGTLEKLLQEPLSAPAEGLTAGGAEALAYRIDHLRGHTPQHMHHIPLPRLATSLLITILILTAILAPLPGSHPLNSDMMGTLSGYLA